MKLPPGGFKLPGHSPRPQTHTPNLSQLFWRLWPSRRQAVWGAVHSLKLSSSRMAPHRRQEQPRSCFWRHLPVSARCGPWSIRVDSWAEALVLLSVVMTHTDFSRVTRAVFVEVDPAVMHATSMTPASRVLPGFAFEAAAHVSPKCPGLPQSGWHVGSPDENAVFLF